jgi:plastocyanin
MDRAKSHLAVFVLLTVALVSACAPPTTSTSPAAPTSAPAQPAASVAPASANATVTLTDALKFDPPTLTVAKGTSVTFRNTSSVQHTVTDDPSKAITKDDAALPAGAQPWDSGNLNPGQTFQHTFDTPGTYKYFCQPHETAGMIATITVTP